MKILFLSFILLSNGIVVCMERLLSCTPDDDAGIVQEKIEISEQEKLDFLAAQRILELYRIAGKSIKSAILVPQDFTISESCMCDKVERGIIIQCRNYSPAGVPHALITSFGYLKFPMIQSHATLFSLLKAMNDYFWPHLQWKDLKAASREVQAIDGVKIHCGNLSLNPRKQKEDREKWRKLDGQLKCSQLQQIDEWYFK